MNIPVGPRTFRFLLVISLCASLIGSGSFAVQAVSPGELLINRVQITGGSGKTDNDFIEIYNATSSVLDLNGLRLVKRTKTGTSDSLIKSWTSPLLLNPGAVYLWANSNNGFATSLNANISSTQTLANDNSIAIRDGSEYGGTVIDALAWGEAQNTYIEGTAFPQNPGANDVLHRINYQDTNNNSQDFHIISPAPPTTCGNEIMEISETCDDGNTLDHDGCSALCQLEAPSLVCGNNLVQSGEECDDGNLEAGDGCSEICLNEVINSTNNSPVFVNEFIVDPVAGGSEWIELYSPSETAFSIYGWTLEEGSGTKTTLQGNIGGENHYFAIPKSNGALNNSGDIIILRDATDAIAHSVTYGDWDDGNISDNAPTAPDPYGVARKTGADPAGSDHDNYTLTSMLTMWGVNIIVPPPEPQAATEQDEPDYDFSTTLRLSEISPNPHGIDELSRNDEFIELYNTGEQAVRLEGWHLEIGDKQYIYQFPASATVSGRSYLIVRAPGNFELANSGTTIKLFQPEKTTAFQSATYKETLDGQSWAVWNETAADNSKVWKKTFLPTPGNANVYVSPPLAVFSTPSTAVVAETVTFDASDSDTPDSYAEYSWNFGDGVSSSQANPEHIFSTPGNYTVVLSISNSYGASTVSRKISITKKTSDISIASLEKEKNLETRSASLISPFKLTLTEVMPNPAGSDTGQEWVEVRNAGSEAINLAGWTIANKSKSGPTIVEAISLEPNELFIFHSEYLPGSLGNSQDTIRLIDPEGREADAAAYAAAPSGQSYSLIDNTWQWTVAATPGEDNILEKPTKNNASSTTAKKAVSRISLTGTVVALPGTFSSQYFYLQPTGSPLLYQVYNSKKLFPQLTVGQTISVSGETSSTAAGPRLKTAVAEDIHIMEEATSLPEQAINTSADIKNPPHPRLARIEGEITSKKSPRLIVTDETGDTEVYLAKGSGLSVTAFAVGDKVSVTGITQLDGTAIRLMPRMESDFAIINPPSGPENSADTNMVKQVLEAPQPKPKKQLLYYVLFGAALLLLGGGFIIWKAGFLRKE